MPDARDIETLTHALHEAREVFRRGQAARSASLFKAALRRLDEGVDGHRPLVVRAMVGLAAAEYDSHGDLDSALERLRTAEASAEAMRDEASHDEALVTVLGQRALMLLRAGRVDDSLAAFDRAESLLERADADAQVTILLNRGVLRLEKGALDVAADDFERCAAIAQQHGNLASASSAQHNQAYVDFLRGSIPRALAAMELAAGLSPGGVHPVGLLDRARVLREAGLVGDADLLLDQAARMMQQGRVFQDLAETELLRAECALTMGDVRRAASLARAARRRFAARGNRLWERRADLLVLHCERAAVEGRPVRGRPRALAAVAHRAEDLGALCLAEGRLDLHRSTALLATEARLRSGTTAVATPPSPRPTDTLPVRLLTREVRALAALQRGDRRGAAREVRKGLDDLGSYQHRFGSLDLRTASAVHGAALAKLHLEVALGGGRPAAVFNAIEQARAVSTRLPLVRPPRDERTALLLAELRRTEEEARALAGDPESAQSLATLRIRSSQLQRDVRARAWELEADTTSSVHAAATIDEVRRAAEESAFVTYARHQGRWVAVTAVGRRTRLVDLADVAEVDELVRRVRADLDAVAMPRLPEQIVVAIRSSIDLTLRRLDLLLVERLMIGDRPLVVSASGSLVVLPWSLLPSRSGVSTVVAPSATRWLRSQGRPRPTAPDVVAISGPDLHRAAEEAKEVGAAYRGATVIADECATVRTMHDALASADVVHVAAHGTHRQDSPLFSSIRLADGQLFAYELDAEDRIAGFVALSACEAGLATVRPGDEGLGLTNVLLQLGTQAVIAGIARVRDDLAADVMLRVHHGVAGGLDTGAALAKAQAEVVETGVPVPFVSFGSVW